MNALRWMVVAALVVALSACGKGQPAASEMWTTWTSSTVGLEVKHPATWFMSAIERDRSVEFEAYRWALCSAEIPRTHCNPREDWGPAGAVQFEFEQDKQNELTTMESVYQAQCRSPYSQAFQPVTCSYHTIDGKRWLWATSAQFEDKTNHISVTTVWNRHVYTAQASLREATRATRAVAERVLLSLHISAP